ncbi:MAG: YraN family protein [Flavobacteriales bacterium]|nr:YraN family protein [Flavobacteriales bacterium]
MSTKSHLLTGAWGEQVACHHLEGRGYSILARNWRHGRDELDIVARLPNELVVVEVKTRSTDLYGHPEEAVGPAKRRKLLRAALAYLEAHDLDLDLRFDVISVTGTPRNAEVFHIEEAFVPIPEDDGETTAT